MSGFRSGRRSCQGSVSTSVTSLQISRGWDPIFETRRELDFSGETRPFIDILSDLKDGESAETASDLSGETFVRAFMKDSIDSDACLPRADRVERLCFGANVRLLLEEKGLGNQRPVALLDDRAFSGDGAGPGSIRGPFTARGLYQALKEKPVSWYGDRRPILVFEGRLRLKLPS